MKFKNIMIGAISLSALLMLNTQAYAEATGNFSASAELNKACIIQVDDMNFGDVSIQAMSGTGDVFATTNLNILCTKDQAVTLAQGGGFSYNINPIETYSVVTNKTFQVTDVNGVTRTIVTNNDVSSVIGQDIITSLDSGTIAFAQANGYTISGNTISNSGTVTLADNYAVDSVSGSLYYYDSNFSEYLAVSDDSSFTGNQANLVNVASGTFNGYTSFGTGVDLVAANGGSANTQHFMRSGLNQIPYQLSMDNVNYDNLTLNGLVYTKNDGTYQTFALHGKANVHRAPVGAYIDTTSIILTF